MENNTTEAREYSRHEMREACKTNYNVALERAAQVAEAAMGGYLCPYGRDKPGDPTWGHTDEDICPTCGADSDGSLFKCHDTASGRIAAAIRALKD